MEIYFYSGPRVEKMNQKTSIILYLQFVRLDVLPQGGDDDGPCLRVHAQQPCQPRVQLELQRLVVEQQENCAAHVTVAGSLHLESVRLLGRVAAVPFDKVVIRSVQILVQLNDEALEEAGELALDLVRVALRVLQQTPLDAQLPRGHRAVGIVARRTSIATPTTTGTPVRRFLGRVEGVGDEDPQLSLLFHGTFQRLLDVQPLTHDGGI